MDQVYARTVSDTSGMTSIFVMPARPMSRNLHASQVWGSYHLVHNGTAASVWKTANLNLFCPESPRFVCPCDTLQERILTSSFHAWLRYVMILRTSLALRFRDIKVRVDSSERLRILSVCVKIDVRTRVEFFFLKHETLTSKTLYMHVSIIVCMQACASPNR